MMKRNIAKNCISSLLVLGLVLSMAVLPTNASENKKKDDAELLVETEKTAAEVEKEYALAEEKLLNDPMRGPAYDYKIEYGTPKTSIAGGYAGNQVPGGYQFPSGGGFYYSESGGPTVSLSFSFSSPYGSMSFGIPLGNKSTVGTWVAAPSTSGYYKLWVDKTIEVKPYVQYRKKKGTSTWEVWTRGGTPVTKKISLYAKRV